MQFNRVNNKEHVHSHSGQKCFDMDSMCSEICPEMQVNEMHALYDKHHKVSPFL